MSFEMKPEIKAVLEKIEFVDRYKKLSEHFIGNPNDLNRLTVSKFYHHKSNFKLKSM
ncbi:hypothetical protein [Rummeliibacillus pycnus]|uniref:hypothetical protein n=1 Tax=Rummeliibacillus pycnus TaxID=101070 RepID=UPI003D286694